MTAAPPVPNLYLIGAMKCGTTSLHRYLARHPQVFMSAVKEPELFLDPTWDEELGRPRADALAAAARGYAGEPVYGEASTSYTKAPVLREDIAARIRRAAPSARLLYVVRDPLERILSEYGWWAGEEPGLDFEEFLTRKAFHFVPISLYAQQAARFLDAFPRDRLRLVVYEEFFADPARALPDLWTFLEVDPGAALRGPFPRHNASPGSVTPDERGERRRLLRERFGSLLAPELTRLEALVGRSIPAWRADR